MDWKLGKNLRRRQGVKVTEFDVMAKDYIRLGFLNEVVSQKSVGFRIFLESEGNEKNFVDIRTDKNVYRFNNFNVSEDTIQNAITFRPIVIGCYLYFKINNFVPLTLDIIKNGTTTVAQQFILAPGENKIEFDPQGIQKYVMKIEESSNTNSQEGAQETSSSVEQKPIESSSAHPFESVNPEDEKRKEQMQQSNSGLEADISNIQRKISELEAKNEQLVNNKKNLISHLEKLQAEYDKDYAVYEADIEEIKSKYTIDDEILKMYADKEITPIEELIARSEKDIRELEEQTKIFIEAKQRKTADIENELKIGKKE